MDYFNHRKLNLCRHLATDGVNAYLITNETNVRYLTGFTGGSSYLVLTAKSSILVSDSRFEGQIEEECPGLDVHIRPHDKGTAEAAVEVLLKTGAGTVGVEGSHLTIAELEFLKTKGPRITFQAVPARVEDLRAIKDSSEVGKIRDAIGVAERAFRMFVSMVKNTDSEKDMADAMESYIRRAGGNCSSFPVIAAVGERGALPHAPPTSRALSEGSKLLLDWGADFGEGYKSDITRTLKNPFGISQDRKTRFERAGYRFETVYEHVKKAHESAVAMLRHGVAAKEVDAAARKVFSDAGFGDYFNHGLGHGIGLDIHEAPRIRQNSDDILQAGMVVTIEPGIYIPEVRESGSSKKTASPGWGGVRLEDDYLITKDGAIRLTTLPHDPQAIES